MIVQKLYAVTKNAVKALNLKLITLFIAAQNAEKKSPTKDS